MKLRAFIRHLKSHGCELRREGAKHSMYWNPKSGKRTSVPRHVEIDNTTARKICKQLDIPAP